MNIAIVFILVFQRNRTDRMSLHMGTSSIWVVQQWLCPDGKQNILELFEPGYFSSLNLFLESWGSPRQLPFFGVC